MKVQMYREEDPIRGVVSSSTGTKNEPTDSAVCRTRDTQSKFKRTFVSTFEFLVFFLAVRLSSVTRGSR